MTDDDLREMIADLVAAQKETGEQLKQTDEQLKQTSRELKQMGIITDEQLKQTSIELKQMGIITDEQLKQTDEKLKRIGIMTANIGKNQGDIAEEFFYHSLIKDNHLGSLKFDDITKNMEKHRGKIQEEYDLFLTNGDSIAVVEVKYKAHSKDIDKLDRKISNFKKLFPIYKDYKLYGALAAFHINDDTKEETLNRGYFALQRSGDLICTESSGNLKVS